MKEKKIKWIKVSDSLQAIPWQENNLALAEVGGKTVTLIKRGTAIAACAYKCPHAGGIMANGFIDALDNIVCPLHRYKFNLKNGRNTSGEGYYLKVYTVEQRDSGIFIGFEETNWPNLF